MVPGGVYVMRVAGFGARSCLGQPLSVCAWLVWCGSVGEPVSCRGLVSELAMGWFRLGEQGPLRLQQKRQSGGSAQQISSSSSRGPLFSLSLV